MLFSQLNPPITNALQRLRPHLSQRLVRLLCVEAPVHAQERVGHGAGAVDAGGAVEEGFFLGGGEEGEELLHSFPQILNSRLVCHQCLVSTPQIYPKMLHPILLRTFPHIIYHFRLRLRRDDQRHPVDFFHVFVGFHAWAVIQGQLGFSNRQEAHLIDFFNLLKLRCWNLGLSLLYHTIV